MMCNHINEDLFESVREVVCKVCNDGLRDPKLILTEGDLEALIYASLTCNEDIFSDSNSVVHIHTQASYKKKDNTLRLRPDIVLLNGHEYNADPSGGLYDQKGWTFWGSSIALELKVLKSNFKNGDIDRVIKDFVKLNEIRDTHYNPSSCYSYYCASVVYCRRIIKNEHLSRLRNEAESHRVPLWFFQPDDTSE